MPFRQSVTIVASPRERAGKTLLARLLVDFHQHENRAVAGFDLDPGDRSFARFLPACVNAARIGDIQGQMALFDQLVAADDVNKVVDLGHRSFDAFFEIAHRIGFAEEALRRSIAPAVLYVLTPEPAAIDRYRMLRERFPHLTVTAAHNELFGILHQRETHPLLQSGTTVLRLPALTPAVRRHIETPPFSFAEALRADSGIIPLAAHAELQHWLRRAHLEFRELDLRVLLADLSASIRLTS
jgi:hypothetical protein